MKRGSKPILAVVSLILLAGMSDLQYARYIPKDGELPMAFEYPQDWPLDTEQGKIEPYRQIRILGPRNNENSYRSYFIVLRAPLQADGKYKSVADFLKNYKEHLMRRSEVLSEGKTKLGGMEAQEMLAQYTMPAWHHQDLNAPEVPVKTRIVVASDNNYLYQLMYSADAREFDAHTKTFERLIETFHLP